MEYSEVVQGTLNTFLLLGLLVTAVVTVFKAGRWFGGIVSAVERLSASMQQFKVAFDDHVRDEDMRFTRVEQTLDRHGKKIETIHGELEKVVRNTNGKAA